MSPMEKTEPTVQQLFDLTGRVALVTGGTGHLGRALGQAFAEAGATVVVTSRDEQRAREAAEELPRVDGTTHVGIALDHLDEASLDQGFNLAVERAGHIDILVNNGHSPLASDWSTVTGSEFTRQLANATGYFLLARRLHQHLVGRGARGSIIMLGSMYGVVGSYPDAYEDITSASPAAYHALKGGIVHLTRHLAVYWAKDGVRVNCLSPGPFPAPSAPPRLVERLATKSPMGRMGVPHELKGAALLFASDAGSYLTGQNLIVDGGWTAW